MNAWWLDNEKNAHSTLLLVMVRWPVFQLSCQVFLYHIKRNAVQTQTTLTIRTVPNYTKRPLCQVTQTRSTPTHSGFFICLFYNARSILFVNIFHLNTRFSISLSLCVFCFYQKTFIFSFFSRPLCRWPLVLVCNVVDKIGNALIFTIFFSLRYCRFRTRLSVPKTLKK